MLSEIFGMLSSVEVKGKGANKKLGVNLNRNRIRSISAYSSNSIFYFPNIVSDQYTADEVTMVTRMIEKSYASFVVACISLMPFHRVSADDKGAIEDYLAQFHQNIGIKGPGFNFGKLFDDINESVTEVGYQEVQDFLYECWQRSLKENSDFVKIVSETVSLNDMYNEDAIDPKTRALQEQYMKVQEELDTWGFIGEATDDMFDGDDLLDQSDEELYQSVMNGDTDDDEDYEDDDVLDDDLDEAANADKFNKYYEKLNKKLNDDRFKMFGSAGDLETMMIVSNANQMIRHAQTSADLKKAEAIVKRFNFGATNTIYQKSFSDAIAKRLKKLNESVNEAAMKAAERNSLPDSAFGLPKTRQYPLNDEQHVKSAIQMFSHCKESDRKELAGNIQKAMKKFKMDTKIGEDNPLHEYLSESALSEGTVKSAIDNIKFSLESVSENKILSCSSLTKLSSLESKLKKLKTKYTKYLNRYKRQYKENQRNKTHKKLTIRFNNMTISDPKAFMKQYGTYIKIINKRLKLVEKRREQLRTRKGLATASKEANKEPVNPRVEKTPKLEENVITDLTQMDFDAIDYCERAIDESLNAPDSAIFGYLDEDVSDDEYQKQVERANRLGQAVLKHGERTRKYDKAVKGLTRDIKELRKEKYETDKALAGKDKEIAKLTKERDKLASAQKSSDTKRTRIVDQKVFDREVFTNMELKKANEAVPTFAKATISFIVEDTDEIINRDILVGIKAYVHKAPTAELVNDVYNCIINKRKFLRFVKFITGEERSLSDLLFGVKELRSDALDAKSGGEWRNAFKRRRRWAKMSVPYLMKEYTPNGTICMTMNEVNYIKSEYGIDIMDPDHVRMIMDADYLLGFVVVDQSEELVYVTYDGHGYGFQTYTYAALERESANSDRMMRELYRSFSR